MITSPPSLPGLVCPRAIPRRHHSIAPRRTETTAMRCRLLPRPCTTPLSRCCLAFFFPPPPGSPMESCGEPTYSTGPSTPNNNSSQGRNAPGIGNVATSVRFFFFLLAISPLVSPLILALSLPSLPPRQTYYMLRWSACSVIRPTTLFPFQPWRIVRGKQKARERRERDFFICSDKDDSTSA